MSPFLAASAVKPANGLPPAGLMAFAGPALLLGAANDTAGKPMQRRFKMDAYNGGLMAFWWSDVPVVVDLKGLDISAGKSRPVFLEHDSKQIVGHSTRIAVEAGRSLHLDGAVSGVGSAATEVIASADQGFPWQSSIGAQVQRIEQIRAGVEITVNHQKFTGPIAVVRAALLKEVSFVSLGADDSTNARMAAGLSKNSPASIKKPQSNPEKPVDKFKEWLLAQGFDLATLSETQKTSLQAMFEAHTAPDNGEGADKGDKADKSDKIKKLEASADDADASALQASRLQAAEETIRVSDIRTICAGKHADIEAKAIKEGWNKDKTELHLLRANRPTAPNIGGGSNSGEMSGEILECAALMSARMPVEKKYSERVLNAADKKFKSRLGLQDLIMEAAWANGYIGHSFKGDTRNVLRAAFALQAGDFSTIDIGGILSNIANKFLLEGFMTVDQAWRKISAIRSVSDFKTITSYRLTGDEVYEKVGPAGEIKHGTLGNDTFTNKAETYAKMMGLSRQDLINDDLGALTSVPRKLGRGAGLKLNNVFWSEFMDNAAFFATDKSLNNYQDGATASLLTITGLTNAEILFLNQTDPNGQPVGVDPAVLLVPSALKATADALRVSLEIRDTTASTKAPTANVFAGRFETVTTPYLSNATIAGYSAAAWYLLADPKNLAAIETVFLNGQEAPTIESAEAEFSTLGVALRGFHDFGVKKQEFRAGIKSKGAA